MAGGKTTYFYSDRPLFGLDVGAGSVKFMQASQIVNDKKPSLIGYGMGSFDPSWVVDGELVDIENIAAAAGAIFKEHLVGDITTNRGALSIPANYTYSREINFPKLSDKELHEAVITEAEQYIPRPLDELYLDYTISKQTETETTVYTVAAPKKIVDSYVNLARVLGIEVIAIEPSISAATRLLAYDEHQALPSVLIDFGTKSADISIFRQHVTVTGTVQAGGDLFTENIMAALGVSKQQATTIKIKYGLNLSKKQKQIQSAVEPLLEQIVREVKRIIRYYEERGGTEEAAIGQVITMGGGANMPGLSDYLTESLRLPVRMFDPWQIIDFGKLQPPTHTERSLYMTVAGLALTPPKELFR